MKEGKEGILSEEARCLYCESDDYTLSQVLRAEVFCPECGSQLGAALEGSYSLVNS